MMNTCPRCGKEVLDADIASALCTSCRNLSAAISVSSLAGKSSRVISANLDDGDSHVDADATEAIVASHASESDVQTVVHEGVNAVANSEDSDQTFVPHGSPEWLQSTVHGVWGDSQSVDDLPPSMTLKSKETRAPSTGRHSLVIKSKSFASIPQQSSVEADGDEPEYELLKILGEGGMGVVYDARQTSIDRNVAVKMLKPAGARNETLRAKFLAEAVVTGDLDHPNIVPIYDVGANHQGALFYSMKKVQGTPWQQTIRQKSVAENLDILMRIADAVGFAHARGIVHCDLKPENVMLGEFGEVLVMDWGLAQASRNFRKARSIAGTNSMGGTPAYMAPEMATGPIEKISSLSDVYLLGAILYEIITGKPPHAGKGAMKCLMAAAHNEIAPTTKEGELVDIARKAMATDPGDRYQDVKSFQTAIREYQSHSESIVLATRAEDDLTLAMHTDAYDHYARALFGFQEAHELWIGNKRAHAGISQAQLAYAESARRKGDFDLGLSLLDAQNPDHANLRRQLLDAQQDVVSKQQRLVFLKRMAIGMAAMVFVIICTASLLIYKSKLAADLARDDAVAAQGRAENALVTGKRAVDEALMQVGSERLKNLPQAEELRKNMLVEATRFYAEFEKQNPGNPEYELEIATAEMHVANMNRELKNYEAADISFEASVQRFQELVRQHPDQPEYQKGLANSYNWWGELYRKRGKRENEIADEKYTDALRIQEQLVSTFPQNQDHSTYWLELARTHTNRGLINLYANHAEEAICAFTLVIAMLEVDAAALPPAATDLGPYLKTCHSEWETSGPITFDHYRRLLQLEHIPRPKHFRRVLGWSYGNRAIVRRYQRRTEDAERDYVKAAEQWSSLVKEEPEERDFKLELAKTQNNLANLLMDSKRLDAALDRNADSVKNFEQLAASTPTIRAELANSYMSRAGILWSMSRDDRQSEGVRRQRAHEAAEQYEIAYAHFQELHDVDPSNADKLDSLGMCVCNLAELKLGLKAPGILEQNVIPSVAEHDLTIADHAASAAAVERLDSLGGNAKADTYEWAAAVLSRCIPLVQVDQSLSDEGRESLARHYAERTVQLLRHAINKGDPQPNIETVRSDKRFEPLRQILPLALDGLKPSITSE